LSNPEYEEYFRDPIRFVDELSVELDAATWHRPGPVYGVPKPRTPRLGQQAFKAVVLDAYHQRCAVTRSRIRPVLQAAHIRPLPEGGEHRLGNGMLLRSDIHTLFDHGYLGVRVIAFWESKGLSWGYVERCAYVAVQEAGEIT
jgi:putative restriction endonuclease